MSVYTDRAAREDEEDRVRTMLPYHRIAQHQDVIGSWVVFDPTGRDLRSCLVVGRVESVTWDDLDDGTEDGMPRPLITVVENGTEERWTVTRVETVLRRG